MSSVATVFFVETLPLGCLWLWWPEKWHYGKLRTHMRPYPTPWENNGLRLHGNNRNQRLLKIPYNQVVVIWKDTITQQIYKSTQNQDIPGNSWHSLIKKEMLTKTLVTSGNSIYGNLIQLSTSSSATEHTVIPWCAAWVTGSFQLVNTH